MSSLRRSASLSTTEGTRRCKRTVWHPPASPVRICLVYDCLFRYTVGGAERWYRNLGERLAAEGHEVTYLTLRQWERGARSDVLGVESSPWGRGCSSTLTPAGAGSCRRSCSGWPPCAARATTPLGDAHGLVPHFSLASSAEIRRAPRPGVDGPGERETRRSAARGGRPISVGIRGLADASRSEHAPPGPSDQPCGA